MAESIELAITPQISEAAIARIRSMVSETLVLSKVEIRTAAIEQAISHKMSKAIQAEVDKIEAPSKWARIAGAAAGVGSMLVGEEGAGRITRAAGFGAAAGGAVGGFPGGALTGGAAGAVVGAIGAIPSMISQLGQFVQAANPAIIEQLNLVFQDITAVIGHVLTPVFQTLTPFVRLFGDAIASILPNQAQMNSLMAAFAPIFDAVKGLFTTLAPILNGVISVFIGVLTPVLKILAGVISIVVEGLQLFFNVLIEFYNAITYLIPGVKKIEKRDLMSSVGAAAKEAQIISSGELTSDAIKGAWGAGLNPMERMANGIEAMQGDTQAIARNTMRQQVMQLPGNGPRNIEEILNPELWEARIRMGF